MNGKPNASKVTLPIGQIIPYEKNPRINDDAVHDVAQSIKECGYVNLIIVDENNVILCGHTRLKALKQLGFTDVDVWKVEGMDDKTKRKYRLLDNKTGEAAKWDIDLLRDEIADLDFGDYDFDFNLPKKFDESLLDELFDDAEEKQKEPKKIQCPHCGEWFEA